MSDANAQAEPSMEEILASIRRIISEDDPADDEAAQAAPKPAAAAAPEPEVEAEPESAEVLDLTQKVNPDGSITDINAEPAEEPMAEAEPANIDDILADAFPDEPASEAEPEPEPEPVAEIQAEAAPADFDRDDDSLIAPPVAASATASFSELARAVGGGNAGFQIGDGRTLEEIVREALMPELKAWLDNNLAALVEKIVRDEIKKLVRRAED